MVGFGFSLGCVSALVGARGGPAAFTPASLFAASEQGVWYDPSDLATMFQDSAGTIAAVVGQPVGYIGDKSGRGNHATQATTANKPILRQLGALYYLEFDGVDDFLVTGSIDFSASDKLSVFAGVRKLSDDTGIIAELSATYNSNPGTFHLFASTNYNTGSHGNAGAAANQFSSILASGANTAVVTGSHNIASDLSTIRKNGVAGTNAIGEKGLGNFGNYPLYIGRRGGTEIPLAGNLYGLIVRSALTADPVPTETWLNERTGAY